MLEVAPPTPENMGMSAAVAARGTKRKVVKELRR